MKKIIALLLACTMVIGLFAACGGSSEKPAETKAASSSETKAAEAPAEAPAPVEAAPAPAAAAFAEPWEEHGIAFDEDGIKSKGFVRSERAELGGVKGYNFYTADGACRFIRAEMAVIQRLAKKI